MAPDQNGRLTPQKVTANSHLNVWWLLPYDDPVSGKHFNFEWKDSVYGRKRGICPFLSGHQAWSEFNDLQTVNPKLATEWHPTKNGTLTPSQVRASSNQKVWWLLPYDDPNSGKHFDFEWQAVISSRNSGVGCPYVPKSWGEQFVK